MTRRKTLLQSNSDRSFSTSSARLHQKLSNVKLFSKSRTQKQLARLKCSDVGPICFTMSEHNFRLLRADKKFKGARHHHCRLRAREIISWNKLRECSSSGFAIAQPFIGLLMIISDDCLTPRAIMKWPSYYPFLHYKKANEMASKTSALHKPQALRVQLTNIMVKSSLIINSS